MTKIKICGITNIADAKAAVDAGADALGFVFAKSPRQVEVGTVVKILHELPAFLTTVGVFANTPAQEIVEIMSATGLNLAQLHGELDDKLVLGKNLGCRRIVRALRVRTEADLHDAQHDCPNCGCAGILLDAHVEGVMGGTGRTFDWDLAVKARTLGKPIILAGGLTPANVVDAIRQAQPYAVDVSSGVEAAPGVKDHEKIKEFIHNVRQAC